MQVLLLELNELNFDHVRAFARRGDLPNLARLMESHGVIETVSEQSYEELEPWIQWVTAHSGLPFKDHGIFRLGDAIAHEVHQIWEHLEQAGLKVGAVSPINAKNRTRDPAFFVPDPWTPTPVSAGKILTGIHQAVVQAVNDNAQARLTLSAAMKLALGLVRYAAAENYARFVALVAAAPSKPWSRPMLLDLLLADVFVAETRRTRPQFASLFLNAAAHIQHHYLFNSFAYRGNQRNPEWYVARGQDPVAEIYRLYDHIVGLVQRAFPNAHLMIATGLHQEPHQSVTFYWRLKDHAAFLRKLSVPFRKVSPRMSRDFLIECASATDAAAAERILRSARHETGVPLFEVDNRGEDLFVMLTWPHDIEANFVYVVGDRRVDGLREDVAFVAIKNGEHNGVGYLIDAGARHELGANPILLASLPARVCEALGVEWTGPTSTPAALNSL